MRLIIGILLKIYEYESFLSNHFRASLSFSFAVYLLHSPNPPPPLPPFDNGELRFFKNGCNVGGGGGGQKVLLEIGGGGGSQELEVGFVMGLMGNF